MVYQLYNLENVCWKRHPQSQPRGNLERHQREKVIQSHPHSDNCVFESIDHVPPDMPNSSHSTQLYILEDNAAEIQMISSGRSQNLRHVTRTHRVDFDWLFERVTFDQSIVRKYVRTTNQLAKKLTKGIFTTIQRHSFLTLWQIRRPYEPNGVRGFFSQTFLVQSAKQCLRR